MKTSKKAIQIAARYILAGIPFMKDSFNQEERALLDTARDSVAVFIPKISEMLRKHQGERYGMTGSESQGRIFYFFTDKHRVDAFSMTIAIKDDKAHISFGWTPYTLKGGLDFNRMITKQNTVDPEVAGLGMMRLVKYTLSGIDYLDKQR